MFGTIKSGMATSMFEIAVVSNNVANSGTTAFRKSNTSFSDLYSGGSADSVARLSKGVGSIVDGTKQSTEQGGLLTRDGVLNLALIGKGMFVSAAPAGETAASETLTFTRDGEFSLDKDGVLRTSTNDFVMGFDGAGGEALQTLKVPVSQTEGGAQLTALEIGTDGKLLATYGSEPAVVLGQIAIGAFPNETALRQKGMNRFQATDGAGQVVLGVGGQDGFGMIQSGTLETSNVDLTIELTDMIRAQQQFSGSSRILQTYSDMIEKLTRQAIFHVTRGTSLMHSAVTLSRRSVAFGLLCMPVGASAAPLVDLEKGGGLFSHNPVSAEQGSESSMMQLYTQQASAGPVESEKPGPRIVTGRPSLPFVARLHNTNTGERLFLDVPASLDLGWIQRRRLNHFMRDWREDQVKVMDPSVVQDFLEICRAFATPGNPTDVKVNSGYRSQRTNELLRQRSRNVAINSLHMEGRAIDFALPKVSQRQLGATANAICRGGVGNYSTFVHIDSGRNRHWSA